MRAVTSPNPSSTPNPNPPMSAFPCDLYRPRPARYPIGSPTCWNASNINCTGPHNGPQCSYGCTQDAAQTIADMAAYDGGTLPV